MNENTVEYIAAGRSLAAVLEWVEARKAQRKAWREFGERHGSKDLWMYSSSFTGDRLAGLIFPAGMAPKHWKTKTDRKTGCVFSVPDRRTKEGKAIDRELNDLPIVVPSDDAGTEFFSEGRMFSSGIRRLGDQWIIESHRDAPAPPDARLLKKSEYWAMKEADDAAKSKEVAA